MAAIILIDPLKECRWLPFEDEMSSYVKHWTIICYEKNTLRLAQVLFAPSFRTDEQATSYVSRSF